MSELLQNQIDSCNARIDSLQTDIDKIDASKAELEAFGRAVKTSKGDFNNFHPELVTAMQGLAPYLDTTACVKKFSAGMSQTLKGVGSSMVGASFTVLQGLITAREIAYNTERTVLTAKKSAAQNTLRSLQTAEEVL